MINFYDYLKQLKSIWGLLSIIGISSPWIARVLELIPPESAGLSVVASLLAASCLVLGYLVSALVHHRPKNRESLLALIAALLIIISIVIGPFFYWMQLQTYAPKYGENEERIIVPGESGYLDFIDDEFLKRFKKDFPRHIPTSKILISSAEYDVERVFKREALHETKLKLQLLFLAIVVFYSLAFSLFILREAYFSQDKKASELSN